MQNNNLDRKKLIEAIGMLSKNPNLREAVSKGEYASILSALPKEDAAEIEKIMKSKEARDSLLSSPQAKEILSRLKKDGR